MWRTVCSEPNWGVCMSTKIENEDHFTARPGEVFPLGVLMQLLYQHWRSPALYAATQLGIADVLGDGSQTVAELAKATGCHTPSLHRLLRALAHIGVFIELDGPRFANSALSQLLRTDIPGTGGHKYSLVARRMAQVYSALVTGQPCPAHRFDSPRDLLDDSWPYCGLIKYFGPGYPAYGVQVRGLARPEPLPTSIKQMAAYYIDQIYQIQPRGPHYFLGWSFGAMVAYTMPTEFQ